MAAFAGICMLMLALVCLAGVCTLAWSMVEPINFVAGHLHLSTRFLLIDFIGLMLLLQGALGLVGRAIGPGFDGDRSPYWVLLSAVSALVLVLWGAAVSVVSRAGITHMAKRLTVVVFLIPATLAVMMLSPLALVGLVANVADGNVMIAAVCLGGGILLAAAAVFVRALSFWSLAGSPGAEVLAGRKGRAA